MNGSNGKLISLLERIAERVDHIAEGHDTLVERVDHIAGRVDHIAAGQDALRAEMNHGFERVDLRLDRMLKFLGGHHADHEHRIKALEKRVFKKSG